jgi:hypothetical protein
VQAVSASGVSIEAASITLAWPWALARRSAPPLSVQQLLRRITATLTPPHVDITLTHPVIRPTCLGTFQRSRTCRTLRRSVGEFCVLRWSAIIDPTTSLHHAGVIASCRIRIALRSILSPDARPNVRVVRILIRAATA